MPVSGCSLPGPDCYWLLYVWDCLLLVACYWLSFSWGCLILAALNLGQPVTGHSLPGAACYWLSFSMLLAALWITHRVAEPFVISPIVSFRKSPDQCSQLEMRGKSGKTRFLTPAPPPSLLRPNKQLPPDHPIHLLQPGQRRYTEVRDCAWLMWTMICFL